MKANHDIRALLKQSKVRWWQVAECLGIQDSALSRKLRHELPEEEKEKIFAIIGELAAAK